ncbi:MAG TPA: GNAT family N-acetyltransferase [Phycisphaerae bacterium]|nr:GNAT family N-acetyltransferase [Phycisphaerae bacterium]
MDITVEAISVDDISPLRESYRREMNCQIIHDSLHSRAGWTQPYLLSAGGETVGYGAVAIGGPWQGKPTIFEFYILPEHRSRIFEIFEAYLAASEAVAIETQTNDVLLTVMLHTYANDVTSEKILFHDKATTALAIPNAVFRPAVPDDAAQLSAHEMDPHANWVVTLDGSLAAAGGILFHYNPPYGDIFMKVAEPFRRRGLGAYLVQELKKVCYEGGHVPAARCNTDNFASRRTLQKAGFEPCGHILRGSLRP